MSKIAGEGTTVLKLYYTRNNYAMTINDNSPSVETNVVNVPFGATTGLHIGTPTWQGHTFTGWSPVPPTTMPAQDVTITAGWTTNSYTVSFESNGGSAVAAQTVNEGDKATAVVPTKEGFVFSGWYSNSSMTEAYNFTTPVLNNNRWLYAKWTKLPCLQVGDGLNASATTQSSIAFDS